MVFDNGTEQTHTNRAILQEASAWAGVSDGDSFYSTFVDAASGRKVRRDAPLKTVPHIPKRLQQLRETPDDGNAEVLVDYPEPYITGPREVYVNGYFMDHPNIKSLAVLAMQTFNTDSDADARRFQALVQRFLDEAKSRGTEKMIIDLQSNGGGRVFLGYDVFRQAGFSSDSGDQALTPRSSFLTSNHMGVGDTDHMRRPTYSARNSVVCPSPKMVRKGRVLSTL